MYECYLHWGLDTPSTIWTSWKPGEQPRCIRKFIDPGTVGSGGGKGSKVLSKYMTPKIGFGKIANPQDFRSGVAGGPAAQYTFTIGARSTTGVASVMIGRVHIVFYCEFFDPNTLAAS